MHQSCLVGKSTMASVSTSQNFNQNQWIIHIRRTFDEELEDDEDIRVSIFSVPKALMASDPDFYTPQHVSLGPYHYWRPELYEMERYKLAAARRTQKQLQSLKFESFVEQLMKFERAIRARYHKYLDFSGETLAWIIAIDASFVLEFLRDYALKERNTNKVLTRRYAHNEILKDMMMLENQIPLFVLHKLLEFEIRSLEKAEEVLVLMLLGLCEELLPFKMMGKWPKIQISDHAHLLDLFYHMIVPKPDDIHQRSKIIGAAEKELA